MYLCLIGTWHTCWCGFVCYLYYRSQYILFWAKRKRAEAEKKWTKRTGFCNGIIHNNFERHNVNSNFQRSILDHKTKFQFNPNNNTNRHMIHKKWNDHFQWPYHCLTHSTIHINENKKKIKKILRVIHHNTSLTFAGWSWQICEQNRKEERWAKWFDIIGIRSTKSFI